MRCNRCIYYLQVHPESTSYSNFHKAWYTVIISSLPLSLA
jgi:hypothetical protein